jgi:hypothetical protein
MVISYDQESVLRIFFRIRIRGAVILAYRPGFGSRRPINYGSGRFRILPGHFVPNIHFVSNIEIPVGS